MLPQNWGPGGGSASFVEFILDLMSGRFADRALRYSEREYCGTGGDRGIKQA
jgi:hypothetical protein